jgi:hypothetical protein
MIAFLDADDWRPNGRRCLLLERREEIYTMFFPGEQSVSAGGCRMILCLYVCVVFKNCMVESQPTRRFWKP